ncbi:MAG: sigma 54-interacting transcriptional regulator [Sporomusaceae bacterium]|nr:sigma 54-interacting transcriptional regulator [Sporomusaceae bacterium]
MKEQAKEAVKLALISTYPEMAKVFTTLAKQEEIDYHVAFAALDEAARLAAGLQGEVDAILSRGGTAEYIRQVVDIPVISIPITPFDLIKSIHQVENRRRPMAFFNFKQPLFDISAIEKMFDLTLHEYTFESEGEIEIGLQEAAARGVEVVIGGVVAVALAKKYGLAGQLIECGEDAVYRSMLEAVHVVTVRRNERRRSTRFEAILDSINEGIIVTDEQNKVIVYNSAAERIFRLPEKDVLGQAVEPTIPNTRMHKVFATGQAEIGSFQEIHGGIITTSRIPLFLDEKPIGVVSTFEDVTKIQQLERQIRKQIYDKGFIAKYHFDDILTEDMAMTELKELAALFAATESAILLEGESGTGKELFAQSIHNASKRQQGPFVAVNCAAIPEPLLESELFGYEGGAFSGAKKEGKQGLFELAHHGTIFLDEIGEIPPSLQARLLRVLQEKEIMRVGGDKILPVDIRILSATNRNLTSKVKQGEFREDLYYRLSVFNVTLPPLRQRKGDIMLMTKFFLQEFVGKELAATLPASVMELLLAYDWPGNIRELRNVAERLALLLQEPVLSEKKRERFFHTVMGPMPKAATETRLTVQVKAQAPLKQTVAAVEKEIIEYLLQQHDENQEKVAEILAIGKSTLWRKLQFPTTKR